MKIFSELNNPEVATLLRAGAVGVIPTDTLYGVVASLKHPDAVERVYQLRQRDADKACIILAANTSQLIGLVQWNKASRDIAKRYWPGPLSMVLSAPHTAPSYVTRGGDSVAVRLPDDAAFRRLLEASGPLIAPSANLQGRPPATTLAEAQGYFGNAVDFYVDAGQRHGAPSTLVDARQDKILILRAGALHLRQ